MTRIINFADGFSSATQPNTTGAVVSSFSLLNNQSSAATITSFDPLVATTHFLQVEIERKGTSTYRQAIELVLVYNSSWTLTVGAYQGDEILDATLVNAYGITLSMSGNNLQYTSGNQPGHTASKIKISDMGLSA